MQTFKTTILVASLAALAGCASYTKQADMCIVDGWYGYIPKGECPKAMASKAPRDFAAELAAAQNENQSLGLRLATVKGLLASRDKDLEACKANSLPR
jgi:hypothetical protein